METPQGPHLRGFRPSFVGEAHHHFFDPVEHESWPLHKVIRKLMPLGERFGDGEAMRARMKIVPGHHL